MDMETPADGWYVYFGVALVSVAVGGIALGMPSAAPPDANAAVNTVDQVTGSTHNATGTYEHDADEVRIGGKQLAMRNEGGTTRASLAFGTMVWVRYEGVPNATAFTDILYGDDVTDHYAGRTDFLTAVDRAREDLKSDRPQWRHAEGELRARTIVWGDTRVTLVDA